MPRPSDSHVPPTLNLKPLACRAGETLWAAGGGAFLLIPPTPGTWNGGRRALPPPAPKRGGGRQQTTSGGAAEEGRGGPGKGSSSSVFLIIPLLPLSSPRRALNENEEGYHHPTNPILYGAKAYGGKERTDEGGKEEDYGKEKRRKTWRERQKRKSSLFLVSEITCPRRKGRRVIWKTRTRIRSRLRLLLGPT